MTKIQKFNKKIGAWVVFSPRNSKGLRKTLNVKQRNPTVPFKGIRVVALKKK